MTALPFHLPLSLLFLALSFSLAFFLSSHFSVPRSRSLSRFLCSIFLLYLFFPLLGKKRPLKSQVIGAFSFYIPFTFQDLFPFSFPLFLSLFYLFFFLLSLAKEKGPIKSIYRCISFFIFLFPFPSSSCPWSSFSFLFLSLLPFKPLSPSPFLCAIFLVLLLHCFHWQRRSAS